MGSEPASGRPIEDFWTWPETSSSRVRRGFEAPGGIRKALLIFAKVRSAFSTLGTTKRCFWLHLEVLLGLLLVSVSLPGGWVQKQISHKYQGPTYTIFNNCTWIKPFSAQAPSPHVAAESFPFKKKKATRLLFAPSGKRGADGRLSSAQAALILQEETIRKAERERQAFAEQVATLERNWHISQEKNRELQVSRSSPFEWKNHSELGPRAASS